MNKQSLSLGISFVGLGFIILLGKIGLFSFLGHIFWPLLILIPGLLLHVLYFGRVFPAIMLIPAGLLTVVSLILLICNWFGWTLMQYLWPLFFLALGTGLYEYYLFAGDQSRMLWRLSVGLFVSGLVLFIIALLWTQSVYVVAVLFIFLGMGVLFWKPRIW